MKQTRTNWGKCLLQMMTVRVKAMKAAKILKPFSYILLCLDIRIEFSNNEYM